MDQNINHLVQEINNATSKAFADLQEGQIFTEKFDYMAIVAIVRKNLIVIYQGTPNDLRPICYESIDDVRKKFTNTSQSGFWVTFLTADKEYLDKLING
jgi:hypothetical protein